MHSNELWKIILNEATKIRREEPLLETLIVNYVLGANHLQEALIPLLASKLGNVAVNKETLITQFLQIEEQYPKLTEIIQTDIATYYQRDFACHSYLEILLFNRGFQALTSSRFAHYLHLEGKVNSALYLQNRIAELWGIDIHPAAQLGKGIVIDHGMGLVIGATAVIEDQVFLFHNVTLGGTGKSDGDRHPKIHSNVLIGAGATILGNINVGPNANIAAGSVVLKEVPEGTMVAGVPAKVIGTAKPLQ